MLLKNKKYILIFILLFLSGLYAYKYINQADVHKDFELAKQYYNQGNNFLMKNNNQKALDAYNKVLEMYPKNSTIYLYVNKGSALDNLGKYQEAIDNYNIAIKLDPYCILAYFKKGISLLNQGKNAEAIENFDKLIELNPNISNAYNNKGVALGYLNKYQVTKYLKTKILYTFLKRIINNKNHLILYTY